MTLTVEAVQTTTCNRNNFCGNRLDDERRRQREDEAAAAAARRRRQRENEAAIARSLRQREDALASASGSASLASLNGNTGINLNPGTLGIIG